MIKYIKYLWARCLYLAGKLTKAKNILVKIDDDKSEKIKMLLININLELRGLSKAKEDIYKVLEITSDNTEVKLKISNKILELNYKTEANSDIEFKYALDLLKNESDNIVDILGTKAALNMFLDNKDKAIKQLKKVYKLNGDSEQLYIIATLLYKKEKYYEAINYFQKALNLGYSKIDCIIGIIACKLDLGKLEEANKIIEKYEKKYRGDIGLIYNKAKYKYKKGDISEARKLLEVIKPQISDSKFARRTFHQLYDKVKKVE